MTLYDAAIVGVVVLGMVWGAWRGLTWQLAGLASLVLGYAVAVPASAQLARHFPGEPVVARALALLAVYIAVSGTVFLVAWLIRATLRRLKFEAFDRHLGMVLGGLEGAVAGLVVTLFVLSLAPSSREPILTSPSGRVVAQAFGAIKPLVPGEVRQVLARSLTPPTADHNLGEPEPNAEDRPSQHAHRRSVENLDAPRDSSILRSLLEREGARLGHRLWNRGDRPSF